MAKNIKCFTDATTVSYYDKGTLKHLYVGVYVLLEGSKVIAEKNIVIKATKKDTNEAEKEMIMEFLSDFEQNVFDMAIPKLFTDSSACIKNLDVVSKSMELDVDVLWIKREHNVVADLHTTLLKNLVIKVLKELDYEVLEHVRNVEPNQVKNFSLFTVTSDISNRFNNLQMFNKKARNIYVDEKVYLEKNKEETLSKRNINFMFQTYKRIISKDVEIKDREYFLNFFYKLTGKMEVTQESMLVLIHYFISLHHSKKDLKFTTSKNIFKK